MAPNNATVTFQKHEDDETERLNVATEKEPTFESILEKINSRGKFQTRLNLIYVCLSVLLCTMPSHMFVMSMVIPDHWCSVPGRPENISVETWKSMTIPRERNSYSKCLMFQDFHQKNETIPCQHGWEYDKTWFSLTIPSQENWVCEKEIMVSNTLATVQGLSVIVGLAICYIGDRFGRRIQYFVSLSLIAICRTLSVPVANIYPLFIVLSVFATAADSSTTEATTAVGLELTDIMYRSNINFQFALMMSAGSMLSPLIAWATGNWVIFMLASSIPCFLLFSCQSFLPESPRWLLNKGHTKKAFSVIRKIAETNKRPVPEDTYEVLSSMSKRHSANMGVLSLVTNRSLFKNTLILVFGRSVCILTTCSMMFNIGNLGGNPFLAFMAQGAGDLPGNLAAHFMGNKYGRRFTEAFSFLSATMVSVFIIIVITVSGPQWIVTTGAALLKFFCVMSLFTNVLQSMEIHPTCVRQIGSAIEWACVAAVIGIAPYIVYLEFTKPTDNETERLNFTAEKETSFEWILNKIGSRGKFQIRLNCIYVCLSVLICTSPSHMFILSAVVPDHWCLVPGRESANVSVEEWKNMTIPRIDGSYSKCSMYNSTEQKTETIPCQYGWEFDKTWFSLTLPSQENWVCDREIELSNTLAMIQGLSVVVGLLICYIGDRFGRRTQYFVSLSLISVCRSLSVLAVSIYPLFIALSVLGTAADSSTTEATTAIGLELTDIMHRSNINFQFTVMYCVGTVVSSLVAWATRNWMIFMLVSSIPCFLLFSCQSFLPESPRWLLNKGHTKKAYTVVHKIAQTNKRHVPADTMEILNTMSKRRSANMGVLSLVTNRNLFKNTLKLIFGRSVCLLTRSTMMFNIGHLGGNPFLAYMVQGAFEFPGNLAAHFLGNRFGRRFTEAFSLLASTCVSIAIIVVMTVSGPDWMVNSGAVLLRFFTSMSLFTNVLQSMEIHPTCVRQIGSAIEWAVVAAMIGVAPYIVHLGQLVDPRCLYGLLGILLFLAAVVTSFLPESLHERLPETLEDATNYGTCQKYWSFAVIKKGWRPSI